MHLPRYNPRVTRRLSVRARMCPRTAAQAHVLAFALAVLCSAAPTAGAQAPPPDYTSFDRDQDPDYTPVAANLLRIWMVYVDQGDGLLIQLPPSCNYGAGQSERLDILIDGGSKLHPAAQLAEVRTRHAHSRDVGWARQAAVHVPRRVQLGAAPNREAGSDVLVTLTSNLPSASQ